MKEVRKIIEIDEHKCTGCGQCVSACAEGAIELIDGKARLVAENYCDGLAACLGECPEDAISIVERAADAFEPEAVEHHLQERVGIAQGHHERSRSTLRIEPLPLDVEPLPCGCPSTRMQMFPPAPESVDDDVSQRDQVSALQHWPVQIRLVPPAAPFLRGADLLVASDCTPVAYPNFHRDFLKGKAVMVGCPKFDDVEEYITRFAAIFRTADIKSVTVAIMEVPCCTRMPTIVREGMALAGKQIPTEVVVIGATGKILKRRPLAA